MTSKNIKKIQCMQDVVNDFLTSRINYLKNIALIIDYIAITNKNHMNLNKNVQYKQAKTK